MNKVIAIIPARSGSKGIKDKNLIDFCGKPLLSWSILSALNSNMFDRVLVSTDSERIAEVAKRYGAETPFIRPKSLSQDHVHSVHVILHALDFLYQKESYEPEAVAMLLPTSPLRSSKNLQEAVSLYLNGNDRSVIGITGLGKNLNNLRFSTNNVLSFISNDIDPNRQRQGQQEIFTVNGAIFISNAKILKKKETFHTERAIGYKMSKDNSIDINSHDDLKNAREIYFKNNV